MIGILPNGGNFAVGFRHKLLQTLLKKLIRGLGGSRCCGFGSCRTVTTVTVIPAIVVCAAAELSASGGVFPLRFGFQPLDGQVYLAVIQPDK